jgi:hypothetical protein
MGPRDAVVAIVLATVGCLACEQTRPTSEEETVVQHAALTAAPPSGSGGGAAPNVAIRPGAMLPPLSGSGGTGVTDVGAASGAPPPRQMSRPPSVPASEHPGHFADKKVERPAPTTRGALPPSAPAAYAAKQIQYLERWKELQPTLSALPEQEQAAQRAALKHSILGE